MRKFIGLLLLVSVISNCSKKNETKTDPFYFKATVNGLRVEWISPFDGRGRFAAAMSIPSGGANYIYYCTPAQDRPAQYFMGTCIFEDGHDAGLVDTNSVSVDFMKSAVDFDAAYPVLEAEFTNGVKTFGLYRLNCTDEPLDGIVITYSDANGKRWRSRAGDPANFAEQISFKDETRTQQYKKTWKVRFACKLYDEAGNYIQLKDGEIYGPVWPV